MYMGYSPIPWTVWHIVSHNLPKLPRISSSYLYFLDHFWLPHTGTDSLFYSVFSAVVMILSLYSIGVVI